MSIDWNWGIFLQQAPFGNTTYLGWLWSGFQVTIALSISAWIIAFFVGSLFGILRTAPNRWLSSIGTCYVELFRNVPLIVQFFTWYLVVPELLPENIGMWFKSELDPNIQFFLSSMMCLGLFTAARVCEQVRAAIQSLPRGQKKRRAGHGPDAAADLSLRTAAQRLSGHCAADDLGDDEPGEKLGHRFNHRAGGYGGTGRQAAGLLSPRLGILYRDYPRLCVY
ncbi:Glutamate/aspartate transport system permease protein gltK [Raoultella ornithinolytica]|nr:Glutamate/aspartate transport system permease protein gltK [Raoultella ornithinolytica]